MRHAETPNEAQFRKVLHYCRTRRHANRDTAIFMVSFFAGLRAKEILKSVQRALTSDIHYRFRITLRVLEIPKRGLGSNKWQSIEILFPNPSCR